MTLPTNTSQTYTTIGIREELSDAIYNISPEETPYMSNCGKGKVEHTFFEFQQDSLAAVNTANAQLEGDDDTPEAIVPTSRVGAHVQIVKKSLRISGSQESIKKAGRKSDLAYHKAKKSAELKRDMEAILLSNQGSSAGTVGAGGTPRKLAGLPAWVKTCVDKGATGVDPAYTNNVPVGVRTDGTLRAFTETMLKNVLQLSWVQGGKITTLMVGGTNKQVVSGFPGIATKTYAHVGAKEMPIVAASDVYVGDFNTISVVANRFQRTRDAWLLDFDLIDIVYFRTFKDIELAKTGDSDRRMFLAEFGHKVKQEAGLGLVTDLS